MNFLHKTTLLVIAIIMLWATDLVAQNAAVVLDRHVAMDLAHSVDSQLVVRQLAQPISLGDGPATVAKLKGLSVRSDWPLAARELAIYEFASSLSRWSRDQVDPDIIAYLIAYQPQVLIKGEDHQLARSPLFNVQATATGVVNHWTRLESRQVGAKAIAQQPSAFLDLFAAADPATRAGYLDALRLSTVADTQNIAAMASQRLKDSPQLSALVAVAVQSDPFGDSMRLLLSSGRGPQIAPTLRILSSQLQRSELAHLLDYAITNATPENAALAIANWWPALRSHAATRQLLLATLADPNLGSAAALALADKPDMQTLHELQQIAKTDSPAGSRAQIALDINRRHLVQEQQQ